MSVILHSIQCNSNNDINDGHGDNNNNNNKNHSNNNLFFIFIYSILLVFRFYLFIQRKMPTNACIIISPLKAGVTVKFERFTLTFSSYR